MPCSLFMLSSANTRAGWPRGRRGRCAVMMRLSRPLEARMTRLRAAPAPLLRLRRRRAERARRAWTSRGDHEKFKAAGIRNSFTLRFSINDVVLLFLLVRLRQCVLRGCDLRACGGGARVKMVVNQYIRLNDHCNVYALQLYAISLYAAL